jgi:hypothetical protein
MKKPATIARPACAAVVCLAVLLHCIPDAVAQYSPREYEVKAAYLLNFTKFIEWPAASLGAADSPFVICVLNDDPFGPILDQIVEGETAASRKLVIQRVSRVQAGACQIVFITGPDVPRNLSGWGPGVLTVGEGDEFLRQGGMIAFIVENRRVRFDINLTASAKSGLKISSKLLKVARSVER